MLELVLEERYPKQLKLKDGTRVIVRPMIAEDESALIQFFKTIPTEDISHLRDNIKNPDVIHTWTSNLDYDVTLPLIAEINGKIIGDCTLHQNRGGWTSHIGTVRVVIHPDHRGKGLATILVGEMVQVAIDSGIQKLEGQFMAEQKGPMTVFEKLGFVKIATLPQHVKDLKGEIHDLLIFVYDLRAEEHYAAD